MDNKPIYTKGKKLSQAPKRGERCKLRGRPATGVLKTFNELKWAVVEWDADARGPKFIHLNELEAVV